MSLWRYRLQVFGPKGDIIDEVWADTWADLMMEMCDRQSQFKEDGGTEWQLTQVDVTRPFMSILPRGKHKAQGEAFAVNPESKSQIRRYKAQDIQ